MILTDYYKFEKIAGSISKTRIDCTASTRTYDNFEGLRARRSSKRTGKRDEIAAGSLFIHYSDVPTGFGGDVHRKADKCLSKGGNISSVYVPNVTEEIGFGDMKGTTDALLFVFHDCDFTDGRVKDGAQIEVFVARGQSKNKGNLYILLSDGELDAEMEQLRKKAVPESEQ